ncbi:MAG: elongation factor Ts [Rhodobacteraceae bacterium]|nr:elongation factor Ts [Paracoccaceae bacterium]
MAITAAMVKELREATGAGMMDAKKALTETDGNMENAVGWLRTKGLAKAARKSGRTTAEGLVAVVVDGGKGVAVEINSETDFVAKNAEFQQMVSGIASAALGVEDVEALAAAKVDGKLVADLITDKIATIGENITLRRMSVLEAESVVSYVHNAATTGMGKIGVLVGVTGGDETFGRQVAMHIAAVNPAALREVDMDPAVVEKERLVQTGIARESGKPEQVIEKMIAGRMRKFVTESTLLNQQFVVSPDLTVEAAAKASGATITRFVRLEVGESIEKK